MHKHVMVIDAAQSILDLCADLLTDHEIRTTTALFPPCTLDDIHRVQPDLLIIDYASGSEHATYQLLQQLRANPATAMIPVLIWTTRHQIHEEHRPWVEEQQIQILPKPCDTDWFLSVVCEHLWPTAQEPRNPPPSNHENPH